MAFRLRSTFAAPMKVSFPLLLTSADFQKTPARSVAVTFPGAILGAFEQTQLDAYVRTLSLLVADALHLLNDYLELALSRLLAAAKPAEVRVVGLSAPLNDPIDLGSWLGVDPLSIISFKPKDRGTPLVSSLQTFTLPYSPILLKAMSKPVFDAIVGSGPDTPAIVFVPSRSQCLPVVNDLITQAGTQLSINGFLGTTPEELEPYLGQIRDRALVDPLLHGIGIFHEKLTPGDLSLVLELFASGIVRVLVVPREACWTLPLRAPTVVVMGTQYTLQSRPSWAAGPAAGPGGSDRQTCNYSLQELFQMQSFAVQPMPSPSSASSVDPSSTTPTTGRFHLLCQAEHREAFVRFLADGLPLESSLHEGRAPLLRRVVQAERRKGTIKTPQDALDLVGHTFLARRARSNPTYYGVAASWDGAEDADEPPTTTPGGVEAVLSRLVDEAMLDEDAWLRRRAEEEEEAAAAGEGLSSVLDLVKEKAKAARYVPGSAPRDG